MEKLTDPNNEWAVAVGRSILAFGNIEHVTVACLRNIPRDKIQRSTERLTFAPRTELLIEILEGHSEEEFSKLSQGLKRAKELAQTRNLIAHNPLVLEVFENDSGDFQFNSVIVAMHKEGVTISLVELLAFTEQVELLATELFKSSLSVFALLKARAGV